MRKGQDIELLGSFLAASHGIRVKQGCLSKVVITIHVNPAQGTRCSDDRQKANIEHEGQRFLGR